MQQISENGILNELQETIEKRLSKIGLLFRIYSRCKTKNSIATKINSNPGKYSENDKKIQDLFGIRIVLYFQDDLDVAISILTGIFEIVDISKDDHDSKTFSPTRCNYVFKLNTELIPRSSILKENPLVDNTFEVQFRTTLSEGWHEVEHDLRYKCEDDWKDHKELDRALNGIFATLSTSDWAMMQLFDNLAYEHYKSNNWAALLRTKFRLRVSGDLDNNLATLIHKDIGKKIYKTDRIMFLKTLNEADFRIPMSLDNLLFLLNHFVLKEPSIKDRVPKILVSKLPNN